MNLVLDVGIYRFCIEGCPKSIAIELSQLYGKSVNFKPQTPIDYVLSIKYTSFFRRFIKPQVCIYIDNQRPFNPINPKLLLPAIEWGMNWCIASYDYTHLLIHSSVLVKNNKAIIFPATPGSGKSTLAAYFSLHGWSVYSDEMAIIPLGTNTVVPMHRPASLKNQSINIIKGDQSNKTMSSTTFGTHKGDIAHLKLSDRQAFDLLKEVTVVAAVFPKFKKESDLLVETISQVEGFAKFVHHSFNYSVLGSEGFTTLSKVVDSMDFYTAKYSSYDGLDSFLDGLVS